MKKPLVFITNDDGVEAKGFNAMIDKIKDRFRIIGVAPHSAQSGMSHAITMNHPLYMKKVREEDDILIYSCSGTPVDCVKIAFDSVMLGGEMPSLILSGINHGANSAINVLYSGTMAAAIEASFYEIPSIGLSLLDHDLDADFSGVLEFLPRIIDKVLEEEYDLPFCVNVNFPNVPADEIKGIMPCRQNKGYWREEFEKRSDPRGRDYYWLTGYFHNVERDATDTDEYALMNNYISMVPIQVDFTNYDHLEKMKFWEF